MSKSFVVAFLAVLVLVPAATAQLQGTSTLSVGDVPATFTTNETLASFPFTVTLEVTGMVCLGTGATVTVSLSAETEANATSGNYTTEVSPSQMQFTVPAGSGNDYAQTQAGSVVVRPDQTVRTTTNVTTAVTATITGITGCPGIAAGDISDTAESQVQFQRPRGAEDDPTAQLPGPGLPLLALGVLAAAFVLRRKA